MNLKLQFQDNTEINMLFFYVLGILKTLPLIPLKNQEIRGINFLNLYLKFHIYKCRFQLCNPNFQAFLKLMQIKLKTYYKTVERKGKMGQH